MEKIYSPFTQEVIEEIDYMDEKSSSLCFTSALKAQKSWQLINKSMRIKIIQNFNEYLIDHKQDIGELISTFMGRPIRFSPGEVETAVSRSREVLHTFEKFCFEKKLDKQREIIQLPLGNILIFGAWNYPVLTAINSIVPAILSGNSVCFRPSAQTFFMGEVFKKAFQYAGLPEDVFQVTSFSREATQKLVQSKQVHRLVYTGSTEGGRKLHQWSAGNFIPVTMELGGKDAAYIRSDVDVESVAMSVADGAFFNSGQSCCGVERIFVHDSIYKDILKLIIREGRNLILGDPLDPKTTLGPMTKKGSVKFLLSQVEKAKNAGAVTYLDDLGKLNPSGQFVRPEVLTNISIESELQQTETFGPFVTITPVSSDEQAIDFINNSNFGLTASIWTKSQEAASLIAAQLEVGVVLINRCDYVDPKLIWRGEKDTGIGQALGPDCFSDYLKPLSIFRQ
jgi:acyl-CoA reductase-like NAD-dependent aldehyde dehydrogenase